MEMKFLNRYASVLLGVLTVFAVSACGDDQKPEVKPDVEINIEVSSVELSFPADGGSLDIMVETDASGWDCMVAASWLEAEIFDDGIRVTAAPNTQEEERNAEIVVFAFEGDVREEVQVAVSQDAMEDDAAGDEGDGDGDGEGEDGLVDGKIVFECPEFEYIIVSGYDADGDGAISLEEAARIEDLVLTYDVENTEINKITSLKGIEYFANLVNLDCDLNALTSLNLSGLKKLEYVDCSYNLIESIDVSGCESLKWIYFYSNNVETIDLSGCPALMFIQGYKNKVRSLDVSGLAELVYFDMRFNELQEVKFSDCPKMNVAALNDNNIASLELKGLPELYTLGCYNNTLSSLDVSLLSNLEMLECYNNNLLSLDLTSNPKVTKLACQNNMISDLKISSCTKMKVLDCSSNRLSGDLDVTIFSGMQRLYCGGNSFDSVDVSENTGLTELSCDNTNITALELSKCVALESVICKDCLIETLDVSANLELEKLHAQGNPLTSLVLSEGQVIKDLKLDDMGVITYK